MPTPAKSPNILSCLFDSFCQKNGIHRPTTSLERLPRPQSHNSHQTTVLATTMSPLHWVATGTKTIGHAEWRIHHPMAGADVLLPSPRRGTSDPTPTEHAWGQRLALLPEPQILAFVEWQRTLTASSCAAKTKGASFHVREPSLMSPHR